MGMLPQDPGYIICYSFGRCLFKVAHVFCLWEMLSNDSNATFIGLPRQDAHRLHAQSFARKCSRCDAIEEGEQDDGRLYTLAVFGELNIGLRPVMRRRRRTFPLPLAVAGRSVRIVIRRFLLRSQSLVETGRLWL